MSGSSEPTRPALADLLGDAYQLAHLILTELPAELRTDRRHLLLLDMLHEASAIAHDVAPSVRTTATGAPAQPAPRPASENVCPLCGKVVPAVKLDNLSRHEFFDHGDCGHFFANWTSAKMIRVGSEYVRARLQAAVREQNAKQITPLLTNLL